MSRFFTRERFGRPQFLAGALLLVFLGECLWLSGHDLRSSRGPKPAELFRIREGLRQLQGEGVAGTPFASRSESLERVDAGFEFHTSDGYDPNHSPLWYEVAAAPLAVWPGPIDADSYSRWRWPAKAPYLLFGILLGASLWYVSRRLFGNSGGYIALALYCFSPAVITAGAGMGLNPETGSAWGTFGAIFTAIAVAHTLYAPREVVLWNWRRITLLGLSLALAVGSQFSLSLIVPIALLLMLWVAPARRVAAIVIWAAACLFALLLLWAAYSFHVAVLWQGFRHAHWLGSSFSGFAMAGVYEQMLRLIAAGSLAVVLALPFVLICYAVWPRARYFGNTVPLMVAIILIALGIASPHSGELFALTALPFLFVFVAGILADLLETRRKLVVLACVWGLLAANALWNLLQLAWLG